MLRGTAADVVPRCLRANEYMHRDLNTGIAVNGTESHSMHLPFMYPTECGPTGLAEAQAPSGRRLILGQVLLPTEPRERAGHNFRVGRTGTTEGLSTARAVAASTATERCTDSVTDSTAKAAAGPVHRVPPLPVLNGVRAYTWAAARRPEPARVSRASIQGAGNGTRNSIRQRGRHAINERAHTHNVGGITVRAKTLPKSQRRNRRVPGPLTDPSRRAKPFGFDRPNTPDALASTTEPLDFPPFAPSHSD
jgi:hypothetical protein